MEYVIELLQKERETIVAALKNGKREKLQDGEHYLLSLGDFLLVHK